MKLRYAYLLLAILTGLIIFIIFIRTLPDGKLSITFCNVGQGDGAYIRFPDGKDMLVDGGPDEKILECLGSRMPFWDRKIDMVLMTHPQKDHFGGLISVLSRFRVAHFIQSKIDNSGEAYDRLEAVLREKHIPVIFESAGNKIETGTATLTFLWPSLSQLSKSPDGSLTGSLDKELNDYSLVFLLSYGSFETLFTGDADSHVEADYPYGLLADKTIEVLKFPHHGSKTAATEDFLKLVHPKVSIISVGKNTYGHPSAEALQLLASVGSKLERTDRRGNITIVSDGVSWEVLDR